LNKIEYRNTDITYFRKAAHTFYLIAITSFAICLATNQPDYFKNSQWGLVLTDIVSVLIIYTALGFYLKKIINLKIASGIYVYTTLINLSLSTWYYYNHSMQFTGNFLFGTFLYCINLVVAGFCIGRKHAFIAAGLYILSFGPLAIISRDDYIYQHTITLLFLILAFSVAVSGFLFVLEKTHNEELALKEEIFNKDKALSREQNKRLNLELNAKQKEVITKSMFLIEYSENNNALISKLNDIKKDINEPLKKQLSEIIEKHHLNHNEKYWKEFETSFLEVNPDFYKKIMMVCPDVSPSELKLASLVRLGLSSKQIGSIISNTTESVDVARSRLRNKLNLPANANLKAYLMNL
jgi:hypothetical protein